MSEPVMEIIPENTPEAAQNPAAETSAPDMPMAWHKFQIKCMLWLAAAYHLFQCVWIFSGRIYYSAEIQAAVYAGLPALFYADHFLAATQFAAAALQLLARTALSRRHARGPKMLIASYIVLLAGWLVYVPVRWLLAGLTPLSLPILAQTLSWLVLLLVNRSYYRKRREIFSSNDN